ncbi:hypothetical protein FACS1894182_12900 [Bacteroidia bacterium]|nr:hypothetical protein FACS1894182_12900 [Bacteroidia bacterium]
MKLKKIKLKNIVNERLTSGELELLKGGSYQSACEEKVCSSPYDGNTKYCTAGDPICTNNET